VKGYKKCCISNARKGFADDMLWTDRKRLGLVASSKCHGDKALTVKVDSLQAMKLEKVTMTGKGQWNLTCSVYLLYEMNFLAADHLIGRLSCIQINIFSLGTCV
jgi:hypothetical protein